MAAVVNHFPFREALDPDDLHKLRERRELRAAMGCL